MKFDNLSFSKNLSSSFIGNSFWPQFFSYNSKIWNESHKIQVCPRSVKCLPLRRVEFELKRCQQRYLKPTATHSIRYLRLSDWQPQKLEKVQTEFDFKLFCLYFCLNKTLISCNQRRHFHPSSTLLYSSTLSVTCFFGQPDNFNH